MLCPSCGYKNPNEDAPFCGGCGKPLGIAALKEAKGAATKDQVSSGTPHRTLSKKTLGITTLVVCAAIVLGGLVIVYHLRSNAAKEADSATTGTNDSTAPAEPAPPQETESTPAVPASQPNGPSSPPTAAFPHGIPVVTPSSQVPPGTNVAASDFGGEIESVKGAYGGQGLQGEMLINGAPDSALTLALNLPGYDAMEFVLPNTPSQVRIGKPLLRIEDRDALNLSVLGLRRVSSIGNNVARSGKNYPVLDVLFTSKADQDIEFRTAEQLILLDGHDQITADSDAVETLPHPLKENSVVSPYGRARFEVAYQVPATASHFSIRYRGFQMEAKEPLPPGSRE